MKLVFEPASDVILQAWNWVVKFVSHDPIHLKTVSQHQTMCWSVLQRRTMVGYVGRTIYWCIGTKKTPTGRIFGKNCSHYRALIWLLNINPIALACPINYRVNTSPGSILMIFLFVWQVKIMSLRCNVCGWDSVDLSKQVF